MALQIQQVISDGISVAASRNGAIFAVLFVVVETVGLLLFFGAGTLYVPVDVGTGITSGTDIAAGGELPQMASSIAILLTSAFTSIITIPLSIIAIRTFVGGHTDSIPDPYIFDRIGRATVSGVIVNFLYGILLFAIPIAAAIGLLLSIATIGRLDVLPDQYSIVVFAIIGLLIIFGTILVLGIVWLHFLFILHEVSIRHRGVLGAFKGSWDTVRGHRLTVAMLGVALVAIRMSVSWFAVPSTGGHWSPVQIVITSASIVASSIVGVFVAAIFARAYRNLRPDVTDGFM
ncbi:hypothetical protein SAMN05192561_1278 [Halopenitus malekzadehii]|uniref:DUF7847 domain-containing protein n=1 Tax=Halopenitus malekzadehii TaxID=1267564 RepID=A0A1H6JWS5_9EURY|nr:hypothetical protein [Halopenitus malekzadehii]SEH67046.1 hypothetical protein SAMN05192561_1278 [Halopenitus malekzadehii]